MTRIGVLPGGGDSPGTNALIRALVLRGTRDYGDEFVGFAGGWHGLLETEAIGLDEKAVRGITRLGGTMLGISSMPVPRGDEVEAIRDTMRLSGVDALVIVGGHRTLEIAAMMHENGIPVIGVPKSIENDVGIADGSLGFATAVEVAAEGIDRLRTTGDAHHRCTVAEVVGARAGWVALHAGVATNAHAVLIPEFPQSVSSVSAWAQQPLRRGRSPLIVVAEGFRFADEEAQVPPATTAGSIGPTVAEQLSAQTGIDARAVVLGGMQRGAAPIAADRMLAAELGRAAIQALHEGQWGRVVTTRGSEIVTRALGEAVGHRRPVPSTAYAGASAMFG